MKRLLLLICVAAMASPLFASDGPMKSGKWQITVETEMAGVPVKIPPVTMSECVTPEQAAAPQPPKSDVGSDCTVSDYKVDGNVVTWSVSCPKEDMKGTGRIAFSSESYEGVTKMKMGDAEITQKLSGKYLGPCDK